MAVRNVIFDFGQVMVHFEPRDMTEKYLSGEDARLVETVVFDRPYWDRLDSGEISNAEVIEACRERLPKRLWESAERVFLDWIYNIPEIEGMRDIVRSLKGKGIHVYLLSNISKYFISHANEFDVLSEFEGCVFSAAIGMVKPNRNIFEYICSKYSIEPSQTVFVDDNPANIAAAEKFGITGYLFDGNAERLAEYLKEQI